MSALKEWVNQDWVRIGTDGKIKGKCGTSKDKKNPDRCLPRKKALRLSKRQLAQTARKKKREVKKSIMSSQLCYIVRQKSIFI